MRKSCLAFFLSGIIGALASQPGNPDSPVKEKFPKLSDEMRLQRWSAKSKEVASQELRKLWFKRSRRVVNNKRKNLFSDEPVEAVDLDRSPEHAKRLRDIFSEKSSEFAKKNLLTDKSGEVAKEEEENTATSYYAGLGDTVNQLTSSEDSSWLKVLEQIIIDLQGRSVFSADVEKDWNFMLNVLTRVAARDPTVRYSQGMNFLAYCFMTLGLSEEDVFFALIYFIDSIGPDYYNAKLTGVHRDVDILNEPKIVPHECEPKSPNRLKTILTPISRRLMRRSLNSDVLNNSYSQLDDHPPSINSLLVRWLPSFFITTTTIERVWRLLDAVLFYGRDGWLSLLRNFLVDFKSSNPDLDDPEAELESLRLLPKQIDIDAVLDSVAAECGSKAPTND